MNEQHPSPGRRLRGRLVTVAVVLALAALLIAGFILGRSEQAAEALREQPVKAEVQVSRSASGPPIIALSPELEKQADIQVSPPKAVPYRRQLQAYGSVLDLQPFTDLGNTVANAKAQLAIAEAKLAASRAAHERAQTLYKNGQYISAAQLQAAEASYKSDLATVQAAQVQAQNAAASALQAWGPILGQALVGGTALAKDLVQHKKVLVQVTLPVGVSLAQPPQTASIETTTGQRTGIDLISQATRTSPQIQGVSFFYTADADSGALPGMNVIASLPVGQTQPGVAIPTSAVVWLQGQAWVYLQTAAHRFTRHEIPTVEPQPGGGYVVPVQAAEPRPKPDAPASGADGKTQGFPTHQPLVVKGAQALLSQEFSAEIQVGGD